MYISFALFQLSLAKPVAYLKGLEAAAVPHTWMRFTGKHNCGAVERNKREGQEEET